MFRKVNVTVLGIVENMSTHICSHCGHEEAIFGTGGGERMSLEYALPLLGQIPLTTRIRSDLDRGTPTLVAEPESEISARYRQCARGLASLLARRPRCLELDLPQINLQNL
jgi:ATP-binding protein involved in chromosome partitioning